MGCKYCGVTINLCGVKILWCYYQAHNVKDNCPTMSDIVGSCPLLNFEGHLKLNIHGNCISFSCFPTQVCVCAFLASEVFWLPLSSLVHRFVNDSVHDVHSPSGKDVQ